MTEIPGTREIEPLQESKEEIPSIPFNIINVKELKRGNEYLTEANSSWYDKFYSWLILGTILSLIFFFISLRYKSFLVFVPFGPFASVICWYVKRLIKNYEPKAKRHSS